MLGNVWEWCSDGYAEYAGEAQTDPSALGSGGVIRGGAWYDDPGGVRAATRLWHAREDRYANLGFRIARGQV